MTVNALRAELIKLRTVRSTYWTLLIAFASNVGLAVLASTLIVPRLNAGELATTDATRLAMLGLHISQIAYGVLGVLIISSEYSSGMIRTTLAAVPRRRTLLQAKALVLTGVALTTSVVSTVAAYLVFKATLPAHSLSGASLSDPGVTRAVVGAGLYLTVLGLLGFGLGALLRSSTGAIAALFGLLFVPMLLVQMLPDTWRTTLGPYIPMESGGQIYVATRFDAGSLGPWSGFGVFCLYAAAAVLAGLALVNRRDA